MTTTASARPQESSGWRPFCLTGLLGACLLGAACTPDEPEIAIEGERPATHEAFAAMLVESGLGRTIMGEEWLAAARAALAEPLEIVPPYAESGGFVAHRAAALGLAFEAWDGQTLRLSFTRRGGSPALVFVELFQVRERGGDTRHIPLRALGPEETSLTFTLPGDGRYVLRLQPELLAETLYDLRIELDAAIPFPIEGAAQSAGSFFGDPRDAGRRQHEGIDIFMPRNTPVVAVASGRAVARSTPRGGNVVWLRTPGKSYYYAHLEKAAFSGARRVEVGEVLGYVGNSGNARTTPPHLHFGVYRRGRGAVDPLPRLAPRRFEEAFAAVTFEPRYVTTAPPLLNLRGGPHRSADVIVQLPEGSILRAVARRGDWLRVRTPDNGGGWIHADYQRELEVLEDWRADGVTWLLDSVGPDARAVAVVSAEQTLKLLGRHGPHLLVRADDPRASGWIAGAGAEESPVALADDREPREPGSATGAGS